MIHTIVLFPVPVAQGYRCREVIYDVSTEKASPSTYLDRWQEIDRAFRESVLSARAFDRADGCIRSVQFPAEIRFL